MKKERLCIKIPFHSEQSALKRLAKIQRQDKIKHKKPIRAYLCPDCNKWHLTSIKLKNYQANDKKTEQEHRIENIAKEWEKKLGFDPNK